MKNLKELLTKLYGLLLKLVFKLVYVVVFIGFMLISPIWLMILIIKLYKEQN